MTENAGSRRSYTADGTYWTGRKRGRYLEVLRLRSDTYDTEQTWGAYTRAGAAVGAAAELAYYQGRRDAQAELQRRIQDALADLGLGPVPVQMPDIGPAATVDLPDPEDEEPGQ